MVNTASKKRARDNSPSSEESESENEFQVEAIIDKRMKGKKIQYLLKWKGYSDADNTVSHALVYLMKKREFDACFFSSSGKIRLT
jgi:hypothetical protein